MELESLAKFSFVRTLWLYQESYKTSKIYKGFSPWIAFSFIRLTEWSKGLTILEAYEMLPSQEI